MNTPFAIMFAGTTLALFCALGADLNIKEARKSYRLDKYDQQTFSRLCAKNTNLIAELDTARRSSLSNDTRLGGELTSFRLTPDDEIAIGKLLGETPGIDPHIPSLSVGVEEYAVTVKAAARIGNGYYYAYLVRVNGAKWRLLDITRYWPEPKRTP